MEIKNKGNLNPNKRAVLMHDTTATIGSEEGLMYTALPLRTRRLFS